ncbi:MAG: methyltransferase domain-containing protein [Chitinophagales bacterium]
MSKYPEEFIARMRAQLGEEFDSFLQSLETTPPVSIRVNPFKSSPAFANEEKVKWSDWGYYLKERPVFTLDPLFHAGTYYVQEASSMFVEQVWKQHIKVDEPLRVLDMCAAPGGKSTHLLSLLNNKGVLVSNEVIPNRNKILRENITKWGAANYVVTQNEAADFQKLPSYFDVILVDAPCSGEGLFRKDKDAVNEWSEANVQMCGTRQRDILQQLLPALKPGGILIYSTCTYEEEENDKSVEALLQNGCERLLIDVSFFEGIRSTRHGYQFYPHKIKGEGFFIAALRKTEGEEVQFANAAKRKTAPAMAVQYLQQPEDFTVLEKGEKFFAIPAHMAADFGLLTQRLSMRQSGIFLGELKGKDFLPAHDLALSIHAKTDLPAVEVDATTALKYLRCETIKAETDAKGWCLVRHQGFNLGWIKMLPNRINNYYPKDWRILMR